MLSTLLHQALLDYYQKIIASIPGIVAGIIVFTLFCLVAFVVRLAVRRFSSKKPTRRKEFYSRMIQTIIMVVGITLALGVTGINLGSMLAGLGLLSVGLSFTLQDLIVNFLAGLQLLSRAPFEIGDFIETQGIQGVVKRIGSRAVILINSEGEQIAIPNRDMLTKPIQTFSLMSGEHLIFKLEIPVQKNLEQLSQKICKDLENLEGIKPQSCRVRFRGATAKSLEIEINCLLDEPIIYRRELHSRALQHVIEMVTLDQP